MSQTNLPPHDSGEISLQEFFERIMSYLAAIKQNWLLIVLIAIPFMALFGIKAWLTPTQYVAKLTFMLEEESTPRLGGVTSLLGSFGLAAGATSYNPNKIIELLRSRQIVQSALFDEYTNSQGSAYFSNELIRIYELHEEWSDDTTGLANFRFNHDSTTTFTITENNALKRLHKHVIGDSDNDKPPLLKSEITDAGIFEIQLTSVSESFSIGLLQSLFDNLSQYYVDKATERHKTTHQIIKTKTDSIRSLISTKQYSLAKLADTQQRLYLARDKMRFEQLKQEIEALVSIYQESLKNLEASEFALQNSTPFVQAIDLPIPPLKPQPESLPKALLIGAAIGVVLGSLFIIFRKLIRDSQTPSA